jgi:hypothetical protein
MIYGFGTRVLTNPIVLFFCEGAKGKYFINERNVNKYHMSFWPNFDWKKWQHEKIPIAVLGLLRGTERLLWIAKEQKINFYYIDHAYFFRASDKHKKNKITGDQSYRICLNQENLNFLVHDKLNTTDINRIQKNKNLILPKNIVKTTGNKILICPPTYALARYYKFKNEDTQLWLNNIIKIVKEQTDKEIVIRYKDSETPYIKDFENAYCIITYQSTLAIEAILNGIPSFSSEHSCAAPVSTTSLNLSQIKIPTMIEIENWIISLLANQFTMEELKNGVSFEAINRLQKEKYIL